MRLSKPINYLLTISMLAMLVACSSNHEQTESKTSKELKVTYVDLGYDQPTAKLMIEGMSCERMCVSAVKKSIAEVPSVEIEDMLFDAEVAVDTLIVHFDPKKVSEKELIDAVEKLAGGDTYSVNEVQLNKDAKSSSVNERREKSGGKNSNAKQYTFSVPNPFEILRKVGL
ncbi:MAG: heavy-metal-associated domain-containing protein [Flavobacteriales bacterium]|nr:heavy-metal-associated domain-containing protein [Flavobacteriales bacterium]